MLKITAWAVTVGCCEALKRGMGLTENFREELKYCEQPRKPKEGGKGRRKLSLFKATFRDCLNLI